MTQSTELVHVAASLPERIAYARELAHSGLLPSQFRKQPANVLYAIEYGISLSITPMAAITGIHVIEGKPSASAGLISGLVRRAGHRLRQRIEHDADGNPIGVCEIVRSDDPDYTFRAEWTYARAVDAGLIVLKDGKPYARDKEGRPKPWERYPEAMLKARAVTECAREACEEVLFGLHYTPEELGAEVAEDGTVIITDARFPASQQPAPPPPPVALPDGPVTKEMLGILALQFNALGVTDADEGLMTIALLTGHKVASTKDLTVRQAGELIDALEPLARSENPSEALTKALHEAMAKAEAELADSEDADVLDGRILTNPKENDDHAA